MEISNTVFEAIISNENLVKFRKDPRVPFSISLPFGILLNKLRVYLDAYLEEKQKIISKYCDKDDNGEKIVKEGKVYFSGENTRKVQEELDALINAKTNADSINTRLRMDVSRLVDGLSIDDMVALTDIVEFYDGSVSSTDSAKCTGKK